MESIDCILVTHNHLEELREILARLQQYTHHRCRIIVVDNRSGDEVRAYLCRYAERYENVSLVLNSGNWYCCRGTNLALALCEAPWVFYFCSKEAFPICEGWDLPCVEYMTKRPRVGLAGALVTVPRYENGSLYMRMGFFRHFRNKWFAMENPNRTFSHVQGGFWILRTQMLREIGFFNERLPHSYMDVEYSYYAESCGWMLGDVPEVRSRHFWTYKDEEFAPNVLVYHPLTLSQLSRFERMNRAARIHAAAGLH
jgi:GT2 family glycosyltransferase